MARVKIKAAENIRFVTRIPVLIQHINYGGHLANDAVLAIAHEVRIRFLQSLGCTEKDALGTGLIMANAVVVYKNEGFRGDQLLVSVGVSEIDRLGFDLYYRLTQEENDKIIAEVETGMVCFDYQTNKVKRIPEKLKEVLAK